MGLQGIDLLDQVAENTEIQRKRWIEYYRCMYRQQANVDIVDTIIFENGTPVEWYFTLAATGKVESRQTSKLNLTSIGRYFIRKCVQRESGRTPPAILIHTHNHDVQYSIPSYREFKNALIDTNSLLWMNTVLMQPYFTDIHMYPQLQGTFIGRYHAILRIQPPPRQIVDYFDNAKEANMHHQQHVAGNLDMVNQSTTLNTSRSIPAAHMLVSQKGSDTSNTIVKGTSYYGYRKTHSTPTIDKLIESEVKKTVRFIEKGANKAIRQITIEYHFSATCRLQVKRINRLVYSQDLQTQSPLGGKHDITLISSAQQLLYKRSNYITQKSRRPVSAGTNISEIYTPRCMGRCFCHCNINFINVGTDSMLPHKNMYEIGSKSLRLNYEETVVLCKIGAISEAKMLYKPFDFKNKLWTVSGNLTDTIGIHQKLLKRRIYLLQKTIWNPESEHFSPTLFTLMKTSASGECLTHDYKKVFICKNCYLIHLSVDKCRLEARENLLRSSNP